MDLAKYIVYMYKSVKGVKKKGNFYSSHAFGRSRRRQCAATVALTGWQATDSGGQK